MQVTSKTCKTCRITKPITNFSPNGTTRRGTKTWNTQCKSCRNAALAKSRKHPTECEGCGTVFDYVKHGKKERYCPECYPIYRKAYVSWHTCKNRSAKKNMPFDLTVEYIFRGFMNGRCEQTGLEFDFAAHSNMKDRGFQSPSIDKINPKLGYTIDNTQFVCWWYNVSKQTFTDEEVLNLCKMVITHHQTS